MSRDVDIIVQTGLRIAEGDAGQHIGKQREHRQRIERIWIGGASGRRTAREIAHRNRHRFGHEGVADFDIVRSRPPQSARIPGVGDLVVVLVQQEDPVLDPVGLIVGRDDAAKHVPFAGIHARRERPVAAQPVSAVDLAGAAGGKDEGRRNQRVGVLVPDQILGAPVEHAEHPVVAGEIGEIPGHRRIALRERIGAIDQRDVVEFGAADALRLHDPEQAGIVQIALGLRRQTPQLLGPGSALAQARDQRPGAVDHGGIGADRPRIGLAIGISPTPPISAFPAVSPARLRSSRCGRSVRNLLDRSKLSDDCLSPDH